MRHQRRAFILPLAVLLCFLMILIAFVLQDQSRKQLQFASLQVRAEQASNAADAGLAVALQELASNAAYSGNSSPTLLAEGPESYTIRVLRAGSAMPDGQSVPSGSVFVLALGVSLGQANARSGALVKVGSSGGKGLPGVYGGSIYMSGGSSVDSYNSNKGGYVKGGKAGSVLTNSASAGSVVLEGSADIFGPILIGPKGRLDPNTSGGTTMNSAYTVWRNWGTSYLSSSVQTTPKDMPAVQIPSPPGKTSVSLGSGKHTLAPGNYDSVTLGGGGKLTLKGGVYVVNKFTIGGGADITVAGDSPVQIYVVDKFDLNNGADVSSSDVKPSLLQINLAEDAEYEQSGGSKISAVIYGPSARINLNNSADVYGSVSGSDVRLSGSAAVHYDEALAEYSLGGGGGSGSSGLTVLFRQRW